MLLNFKIFSRISIHENSYLICDVKKNELIEKRCAQGEHFVNGTCLDIFQRHKRQDVIVAGRVGDYCSFNADCLNVRFWYFSLKMEKYIFEFVSRNAIHPSSILAAYAKFIQNL